MLIKIFFPITGTPYTANSTNTFREVAQLEIPNNIPIEGIYSYCQNGIVPISKYPKLLLRSLSVGDVVQISNTNTYLLYENFSFTELSSINIQDKSVESTTDKDVEDFIFYYDRCRLHPDNNHIQSVHSMYKLGEINAQQFFGSLLSMVESNIITDTSLIIILNQFIPVIHPCLNQFFEFDYTI